MYIGDETESITERVKPKGKEKKRGRIGGIHKYIYIDVCVYVCIHIRVFIYIYGNLYICMH
jgi:cell division protein FtsL